MLRRRFFQGLEKRVKTRESEHVNFVNEIDLDSGRASACTGRFPTNLGVINSRTGGRVYLDKVDKAIFLTSVTEHCLHRR